MLGIAERDIVFAKQRYCSAVQNSDIFAFGERGGKYAIHKSSRRVVRGISRFCISRLRRGMQKHIACPKQISQIREDLYRFSLSDVSDKLNFQYFRKCGS
jgi:hypothetical protein